jgi:hypothetical protein
VRDDPYPDGRKYTLEVENRPVAYTLEEEAKTAA